VMNEAGLVFPASARGSTSWVSIRAVSGTAPRSVHR
jgi:hypothetical protein